MFENLTLDELNTQYALIKDVAGTEALAKILRDAIDAEEAKAAKLAATAATRALADQANNVLAGLIKSPVTEISGPDSAILRNARLMLRGLISEAYGISAGKADKAIMVLTDTRGQTDSNGSVSDAVAYVEANKTSTVYRQTESHPADVAQSAPADKPDSKNK
jgi:hypothetical protein